MLKSGSAFWLRYQDSPVQGCTVASPRPLLRWKSVQYSMAVGSRHCRVQPEAVGHWQWSSMVLIPHSRLQGGLLRGENEQMQSATWWKWGEAINNNVYCFFYVVKGIHARWPVKYFTIFKKWCISYMYLLIHLIFILVYGIRQIDSLPTASRWLISQAGFFKKIIYTSSTGS